MCNQLLYLIIVSIKITLTCLTIPKFPVSFKKHSKIPLSPDMNFYMSESQNVFQNKYFMLNISSF